MTIHQKYVLALGIIVCPACFASATEADRSTPAFQYQMINIADQAVPVDPVVEEPLRPLLPEGLPLATNPSTDPSCGAMGSTMAPIVLFLLTFRLAPPRRRRSPRSVPRVPIVR